MDDYLEQKVAERDSAKVHYDYLVKKYDDAAEKFHSSGEGVYLRDCFMIGDLLMDAHIRLKALEEVIAENQARIEEEAPRYEGENEPTLADFSPYGSFTFNRYSFYTFAVLFGVIGFVILCTKIGW